MDHVAIKERLLRSRRDAAAELEAIKAASPLTEHDVMEHIRAYVLDKYLLDADTPLSANFGKLTELSLSRSSQISPELVKEFDTAQSCDGATSAMAKKVLLARSIEKGLDVQLDAPALAKIETLGDFCEVVWRACQHWTA